MKPFAMKLICCFFGLTSLLYGGSVIEKVYWGEKGTKWIDELDCKEVRAVETQQTIKVDGCLDESDWNQANSVDDFLWLRSAIQKKMQKFANQAIGDVGSVLPTQKTVVRVLYDSQALYFGIECFEKDMKNIRAVEADNSPFLWKDDCVEIFLDPTGSGSQYYQFVSNAAGKKSQFKRSATRQVDNTWVSRWQTATMRKSDRWILEVRIPFEILGTVPAFGSVWNMNVGREEQPHGEISSWNEMMVTFQEPLRFGRLIFATENNIRMKLRVPTHYGVGINKVDVHLTRRDDNPSSDVFYLTSSDGNVQWNRVLVKWDADGHFHAFLPIPLSEKKSLNAIISLVDSQERRVLSRGIEIKTLDEVMVFESENITLLDDEKKIRIGLRINLAPRELANATLEIVGPTGSEEIKIDSRDVILDLLTGKINAGSQVTFQFFLKTDQGKLKQVSLNIPILESPF